MQISLNVLKLRFRSTLYTLKDWLFLFCSMALQTSVTRPFVLSLMARQGAGDSTINDMK